jgi:membrane protein implicated in regulation of membrane protease activity
MNRTRLIFFSVLAVCIVILAASLAGSVISATALLPIFVGCTIFGVGVVFLDFLGLLGHHGDDGLAGTAGHIDGAGLGAHDVGGHDLGGHDLSTHDAGAHDMGSHGMGPGHPGGIAGHDLAGQTPLDHPAEAHPETPDDGLHHEALPAASTAGHLPGQGAATVTQYGPDVAPVLSLLAYLRLLVYFCLGFGPAGWVVLASGRGALASLAIAVPFGLASLFAARAFFRFQRRDTGAVLPESDVLREQAEVIVPLDGNTMGKVRVRTGMTVTDLYALAADPETKFNSGDRVRIVHVTGDCVYVR